MQQRIVITEKPDLILFSSLRGFPDDAPIWCSSLNNFFMITVPKFDPTHFHFPLRGYIELWHNNFGVIQGSMELPDKDLDRIVTKLPVMLLKRWEQFLSFDEGWVWRFVNKREIRDIVHVADKEPHREEFVKLCFKPHPSAFNPQWPTSFEWPVSKSDTSTFQGLLDYWEKLRRDKEEDK